MYCKKRYIIIILTFKFLFLTSCSRPEIHEKIQYKNLNFKHIKINNYKVFGSITYIIDNNKICINFNLKKITNRSYSLFLMTPIGIKILQLTINNINNKTIFFDNQGKIYSTDYIKNLIYQLIKIDIPVINVFYWIVGLPGNCNKYILNNTFRLSNLICITKNSTWNVFWLKNKELIPQLPIYIQLIQNKKIVIIKINKWIIPI